MKKINLNYNNNIFKELENKILNYISNKNNIGLSTYKERKLLEFIKNEVDNLNLLLIRSNFSNIKDLFVKSKLTKYSKSLGLTGEESRIINSINEYLKSNILFSGNALVSYIENLNKEIKNEVIRSSSNYADRDSDYSKLFREQISKQGLVGFVDDSGKKWTYGDYNTMLLRTGYRMAQNYGTLYTFEHIDLYKMSSHGSTCPICAPLEGRVYSRSGKSNIYPPLASAFGKIDKNGPNELDNTYLCIHPNCIHSLHPFSEVGIPPEELDRIRNFSSFASNPPNIDPRTEDQINNYRLKQKYRRDTLNNYKQFQNMKLKIPNFVKSFNTFLKHKNNNSELYKNWIKIISKD